MKQREREREPSEFKHHGGVPWPPEGETLEHLVPPVRRVHLIVLGNVEPLEGVDLERVQGLLRHQIDLGESKVENSCHGAGTGTDTGTCTGTDTEELPSDC